MAVKPGISEWVMFRTIKHNRTRFLFAPPQVFFLIHTWPTCTWIKCMSEIGKYSGVLFDLLAFSAYHITFKQKFIPSIRYCWTTISLYCWQTCRLVCFHICICIFILLPQRLAVTVHLLRFNVSRQSGLEKSFYLRCKSEKTERTCLHRQSLNIYI